MKISPLELLSDVSVMTEVDGKGQFLPLPKNALQTKIDGTLGQLIGQGKINFIALSALQKDQEGLPTIPAGCTLIEAKNPADLLKQLEDEGGRFGGDWRDQAKNDYNALQLPGKWLNKKDWDRLYQVPNLREMKVVKKSKSLTNMMGQTADEEAKFKESPGLHEWEEQIDGNLTIEREFEATEFLNGLKGHGRADKNSLVIGPPGSGKSSFLGWLGRQLATGQKTPAFPLQIKLPLWEAAWLHANQNYQNCTLIDFLVDMTKSELAEKETADKRRQFLTHWLTNSRLVLLFDGLDEIDDPFFDYLRNQIKEIPEKSRFVISCRTVWQKRYDALNLPLLYLTGLSEDQRDRYITAFPWDKETGEKRQGELIDHLPKAHGIAKLAANPQMLSFLCHTIDADTDLPLPLVRVELIEAMLRNMLEKPLTKQQSPFTLKQKGYDATALTEWLGKIAFALFTTSQKRSLVFSQKELEKLFNKAVGSIDNKDQVRSCFITELAQRGLLRQHPKGYFFFHLIIQEYLVACELARRIESKKGFAKKLTFAGEKKPLGEWLYDWSLDPLWEEIMLLTAGVLEKPVGYLEHIYKPDYDISGLGRLILTVRMVGEVQEKKIYESNQLKIVISPLIDKTINLWINWEDCVESNLDVSYHCLGKCIPIFWCRPDRRGEIDQSFGDFIDSGWEYRSFDEDLSISYEWLGKVSYILSNFSTYEPNKIEKFVIPAIKVFFRKMQLDLEDLTFYGDYIYNNDYLEDRIIDDIVSFSHIIQCNRDLIGELLKMLHHPNISIRSYSADILGNLRVSLNEYNRIIRVLNMCLERDKGLGLTNHYQNSILYLQKTIKNRQ